MILTYRKTALNDLPEICRIVQSAVAAMERDHIFQWDHLYPAEEDFQEDAAEGRLYVGLADGQLAVVYALNQKYDQEYENGKWNYQNEPFYVLHRLCVNPVFQNKGIATAALLHIEAQVTELGVHLLRLDVFSRNPYALKLYRSLGYSEAGYADWRKGRFILMEKRF